jgi:hypothetical protein
MTMYVIARDRETGQWVCLGRTEWHPPMRIGRKTVAGTYSDNIPRAARRSPFWRDLRVVGENDEILQSLLNKETT